MQDIDWGGGGERIAMMHHPPSQRPYTTNNHGLDYSCLLIPKYNNSREKT